MIRGRFGISANAQRLTSPEFPALFAADSSRLMNRPLLEFGGRTIIWRQQCTA